MTERRLTWVAPWREWDQCERLRRAVVARFIDHELPPLEFGDVVNDDKLWLELVDLAADTWRGSRYLDKVRAALREDGGEGRHARARLIEQRIE